MPGNSSGDLAAPDPEQELELYRTLGVRPDASPAEISSAYRHLSRSVHPDRLRRHMDPETFDKQYRDINDEMGKISAAYEVLSDTTLREIYDTYGDTGVAFALKMPPMWDRDSSNDKDSDSEYEDDFGEDYDYGQHFPEDVDSDGDEDEYNRARKANATSRRLSMLRYTTQIVTVEPQSKRLWRYVERELRKQKRRDLSSRLVSSSMFQMGLDLSPGFDSALADESSLGVSFMGLAAAIDSPNFVIQQSVSAPLSRKDNLTLQGYAGTRRSLGFGDASLQWVRTLDAGKMHLVLYGSMAGKLAVNLQRQVSGAQRMVLGVSSEDQNIGISFGTTRNISDQQSADLRVNFGGRSRMSYEHTAQTEQWKCVLGVNLVQGLPGLSVSLRHKQTPSGKASVSVGAQGIDVSLHHGVKISDNSRVSTSLSYGLVSGLVYNIKYKRGDKQFVIPLKVSNMLNPRALLVSMIVEIAWSYAISAVFGSNLRRKELRISSDRVVAVRHARNRAYVQQEMMRPTAESNRAKEEMRPCGLIILQARFGLELQTAHPWLDVDKINDPDQTVVDPKLNREVTESAFFPPNIDARIPLQYMVHNGTLQLPAHGRTSLLGFCDPAIADKYDAVAPELFVRYAYAGRIFEITASEGQELTLPSPNARDVGERYSSAYSTARLELYKRALSRLQRRAAAPGGDEPLPRVQFRQHVAVARQDVPAGDVDGID